MRFKNLQIISKSSNKTFNLFWKSVCINLSMMRRLTWTLGQNVLERQPIRPQSSRKLWIAPVWTQTTQTCSCHKKIWNKTSPTNNCRVICRHSTSKRISRQIRSLRSMMPNGSTRSLHPQTLFHQLRRQGCGTSKKKTTMPLPVAFRARKSSWIFSLIDSKSRFR